MRTIPMTKLTIFTSLFSPSKLAILEAELNAFSIYLHTEKALSAQTQAAIRREIDRRQGAILDSLILT